MAEKIVRVSAGKGYDVRIGPGLFAHCGEQVKAAIGSCRAAVVTDSAVAGLYLDTVRQSMTMAGFEVERYIFPAGEESKNITMLSGILEFLAGQHFTRSDVVIALGGGVTGDMAGFSAAVYLRGIRFVQIPTTLLAAVDSSVGGKTAVNLAAGKNLAGAFKQPELVICDTDCLKTLPASELENGLAEAIKCGVLTGGILFDMLAGELLQESLPGVIEACVSYKGSIVCKDELDNGERRLLNLGHTIGHAIEKCSNYTVPHGRAVASGMAMIARAGEAMGITAAGTAEAIAGALVKKGLPVNTEYEVEQLAYAAMTDKKRMGDTITMVFPHRIGECFLHTIPVNDMKQLIRLGKGE